MIPTWKACCTGTQKVSYSLRFSMVHKVPYSGNLSRKKTFAKLVGKWNFTEKTFVDCSLVQPTVHQPFKQSQRKPSLISTKQQIRESFLPRKFPAIRCFPRLFVSVISQMPPVDMCTTPLPEVRNIKIDYCKYSGKNVSSI